MTDRLYRYEVDTDPAALEPGPMIVAFDGFFDAGMAQRLLVDHLLEASEPTVVASFDVDDLIDYRSRRPVITFDANRYTDYNDPACRNTMHDVLRAGCIRHAGNHGLGSGTMKQVRAAEPAISKFSLPCYRTSSEPVEPGAFSWKPSPVARTPGR